jgi:hypothetical protein
LVHGDEVYLDETQWEVLDLYFAQGYAAALAVDGAIGDLSIRAADLLLTCERVEPLTWKSYVWFVSKIISKLSWIHGDFLRPNRRRMLEEDWPGLFFKRTLHAFIAFKKMFLAALSVVAVLLYGFFPLSLPKSFS